MAERTVSISERDRWIINIVAQSIRPANFDQTRKLNRIWDMFGVEEWMQKAEGRTVEELSREPIEVRCEESAFNYFVSEMEPTLGRLNPQAPAKMIASELLALHDRLTKDDK